MNVGDRIKFSFGGTEKEGLVVRVFPKKVYLRVDFPKQAGKIVIRSLAELEGRIPRKKKSKKREKAEKERKEKKEQAQASKEKENREEKE
jgi:hypothetical protein